MSKTVVFLGAGASKAFGYPLVREILPLIVDGIHKRALFKAARGTEAPTLYTNLLKELLIHLSPGLKEGICRNTPASDWPLVTDLLSQAAHIATNQQDIVDWNNDLPFFKLQKTSTLNQRLHLSDLLMLLDVAIIEVILKQGNVKKDALDPFIKWVKNKNKLQQNGRPSKDFVSIITTNYDYSFEWNALDYGEASSAYKLIDYGLNWRDVADGEIYLQPLKPQFKVFKLHGSIDWLKCPRCGFLYINPTTNITHIPLSNEKNNATDCHCGYWPLQPVLVTPSYVREYRDVNIVQVWRNALEELRLADHWIIAGYSLPNEDFGIKSLFLRALHGKVRRPKIAVVQKGSDSKVKYEHFFGINQFNFFSEGMEGYAFTIER